MSSRIMTVEEANEYCRVNGYKMFIDMCRDNRLVIIKPEVETLYEKHFDATWGTVSLITREDAKENSLELWVGGKFRYKLVGKDV